MLTIIIFAFIFSVIVIFHEFGHYFFAKRAGILVREFSIGMGPRIFHYEGDETTYSLRLLPLGGYVRMAGLEENDDLLQKGVQVILEQDEDGIVNVLDFSGDEQNDGLPVEVMGGDLEKEMRIEGIPYGQKDVQTFKVARDAYIVEEDGTMVKVAPIERQFQSASWHNRLLTNLFGPLNNFILGFLVFVGLSLASGGLPSDQPIIGEVIKDTPAQEVGLKANDKILAIDGQKMSTFSQIRDWIQQNPSKEAAFEIQRSDQRLTKKIKIKEVPNSEPKIGQIGIAPTLDRSLLARLEGGFLQAFSLMGALFTALASLFSHFSVNKLGGPVYMYQATSQVVGLGSTAVFNLLGYLSLNLGVMNLLPFPALDGGKVFFLLIEKLIGHPVSEKVENTVNLVGVALLLILFVAVTWNDLMRLF